MDVFEEIFKTKAQGTPPDLDSLKMKLGQKTSSKVFLIEANRAKNLAITLRKGGMSASGICTAIETYAPLQFPLKHEIGLGCSV